MSREQALFLILRHPYLKQYIADSYNTGQSEAIIDLLFGLEFEDSPTFH